MAERKQLYNRIAAGRRIRSCRERLGLSRQGMAPSRSVDACSFSQRLAQARISPQAGVSFCKKPWAIAWAIFPNPKNPMFFSAMWRTPFYC